MDRLPDEHGMGAGRDHRTDLGEVGGHRLAVTTGHDEARALALGRADRAEDVGGLRALIVRCGRPCPAPRPPPGDLVLLPYPGFVLEPQLYVGAGRERRADFFQAGGEVFLKASMAPLSWA